MFPVVLEPFDTIMNAIFVKRARSITNWGKTNANYVNLDLKIMK